MSPPSSDLVSSSSSDDLGCLTTVLVVLGIMDCELVLVDIILFLAADFLEIHWLGSYFCLDECLP